MFFEIKDSYRFSLQGKSFIILIPKLIVYHFGFSVMYNVLSRLEHLLVIKLMHVIILLQK